MQQQSTQQQNAFSLRAICKQRLKSMFVTLRQERKEIKQYLLVVDAKTLKVVSAFLKMAELLELGITAIENLNLVRKPFKMDAIYFITPTFDSVNLLCQDFNDPLSPQYSHVHLFFNNNIPDSITNKIRQNESLLSKIKTFKIFNLDFSCSNDLLFSLDIPYSLQIYNGRQTMLHDVAEKLSTLLISFEKFFSFEIIYRHDDLQLCEQVAQGTQRRLTNLLTSLEKSQSEQYDTVERGCGKVYVVIVDRSIDVVTPLLHDFFYQPMIYDLLNIDQNVYDYEQSVQGQVVQKKSILNDYDDLFKRYKFKHIGEVLDGIPSEFKHFVANNTTAKVQSGQLQNLDLTKMSDIIRGLPQYNELLATYVMHMSLIEKSWSLFEKKDLKDVGDIEQTLATGIDREGKSLVTARILSRVQTKLLGNSLDEFEKLRLVLQALISLQVAEQDRRAMTDILKPDLQMAIHNLKYLGINPQTSAKKSKSSNRVSDQMKKMAKNKMANATMDLCRNTPIIETVVESIVTSSFQAPKGFGTIKINSELINAGGQGGKSLRKKGKLAMMMQSENDSDTMNSSNKLVVFMLGGLAYNELRSLLSNPIIMTGQVTVVGSTELIKPNDFAKELCTLQKQY